MIRVRIKTRAHIQLFALCGTAFVIFTTELTVLAILNVIGPEAFAESNILFISALISCTVALPTLTYIGYIIQQLSLRQADLRRLAETDGLTGLINRRSFFSQANKQLRVARGTGSPTTLLVLDADYFKQLNDTYGHATGDAALKFISEKLKSAVRERDLTCRLGGEEFAVLVPGLTQEQAATLASRILETVSEQPMLHENKIIEMSLSCGVADTEVGYDMTTLFKAADRALYAAKAAGRNQTILHEPDQDYPLEPSPA